MTAVCFDRKQAGDKCFRLYYGVETEQMTSLFWALGYAA